MKRLFLSLLLVLTLMTLCRQSLEDPEAETSTEEISKVEIMPEEANEHLLKICCFYSMLRSSTLSVVFPRDWMILRTRSV